MILMEFKNSTTTPAHRCNSRGYRTNWEKYGVNLIISVGVLYYVRDGSQEIYKKTRTPDSTNFNSAWFLELQHKNYLQNKSGSCSP
jgi:hypothetical protein